MATTTNYGWDTPDDTDLVKDGAAAIRTLGSSVDTTTKALNPSTTLGDIEYRSATADTNTRLGIGTTGQVLTVAGGVPSWATSASGGWTLIQSGSLSGNVYTVSSIPSTYKDIRFVMKNGSASGGGVLFLRLNGDTATNYYYTTINSGQNTSYVNGNSNIQGVLDFNGITAGQGLIFEVYEYAATDIRKLYNEWQWNKTNYDAKIGGYNNSAAITSLSVQPQSSNWSAGTWELWGIK
jgi:hypothetical protein